MEELTMILAFAIVIGSVILLNWGDLKNASKEEELKLKVKYKAMEKAIEDGKYDDYIDPPKAEKNIQADKVEHIVEEEHDKQNQYKNDIVNEYFSEIEGSNVEKKLSSISEIIKALDLEDDAVRKEKIENSLTGIFRLQSRISL